MGVQEGALLAVVKGIQSGGRQAPSTDADLSRAARVAEAAFSCLVEGCLFRCAVSMRFHADFHKEPYESADNLGPHLSQKERF